MRAPDDVTSSLPGRPEPEGLDGQWALQQVRAQMFGRQDPLRFGRYRVLRRLGRGSQGQVFEARDEVLRRSVALKVITSQRVGAAAERERQRLLREARALAQVEHPHVVSVFAAGATEEHVWIAMELVGRQTLSQWVAAHPVGGVERFERARRLLHEAGSGLAAAHRGGVVHRDFKPANVLVGDDETAKVADFGLATPADGAPATDDAGLGVTHDRGGLRGTPRYMSPEQLRCEPAGPASDQFNFAVTAWEVVTGTLPLERGDASEPGIVDHAVPAAYLRALRRALAPRPEDRYPSMDALLAAIDPRRRRRGPLIALAAVAVAAAVGLGVRPTGRASSAGPTCDPATAARSLEPAWNPRRAAAVREGLAAFELQGAGAPDRIVQALAEHAEHWSEVHTAACRARWFDASLGEAELDATMACLHHGLDAMDAVVERLATADRAVAVRAAAVVGSLPPPRACLDAPDASARPDTEIARKLRRRLASTQTEYASGRYEAAVHDAMGIAARARAAQLEPFVGDALELAAQSWAELEDDRAYEAFVESHAIAVAEQDDRSAARRAVLAGRVHAYHRHIDEAERWLRHADTALSRVGGDSGLQRAAEHVRGLLAMRADDYDDAAARFEAVRREAGDPTRDEVAWLAAADLLDIYTVQRPQLGQALATALDDDVRTELGPQHPRRARLALDLANVAARMGRPEEALAHVRRAAEVSLAAYGPRNTRSAVALVRLGVHEAAAENLDASAQAFDAAVTAAGERPTAWKARAFRGVGIVEAAQGQLDAAAESLARAVAIGRDVWPADGKEFAVTRRTLAETWVEVGRLDDARLELERLLGLARASALAAERRRVQLVLGVVAERQGRVADARALYEVAADGCPASDGSDCAVARQWADALDPQPVATDPAAEGAAMETAGPVARAAVDLGAARRSWVAGRPAEARDLARRAAAQLTSGRDFVAREQRRRVQRWRTEHDDASDPS